MSAPFALLLFFQFPQTFLGILCRPSLALSFLVFFTPRSFPRRTKGFNLPCFAQFPLFLFSFSYPPLSFFQFPPFPLKFFDGTHPECIASYCFPFSTYFSYLPLQPPPPILLPPIFPLLPPDALPSIINFPTLFYSATFATVEIRFLSTFSHSVPPQVPPSHHSSSPSYATLLFPHNESPTAPPPFFPRPFSHLTTCSGFL